MSATVTSLPRIIDRGLTYEFRFRYKDSTGAYINLDGRPLTWAYRDADSEDAILEINNTGTPSTLGSTFVLEVPATPSSTGTWLLTLSNAETAAMTINDGHWWLRWQQDDSPANDRKIGGGPLRVRNP